MSACERTFDIEVGQREVIRVIVRPLGSRGPPVDEVEALLQPSKQAAATGRVR